jgi:RNA polymerase sigma-B factor
VIEEVANSSTEQSNNGKIIEEHLDFLREIVQEFQNSGESEEVLLQAGYIGLLNAVNLYQKQQNITFQEYARNLICGEIRNYIRGKNKKVDVPDWLSIMINKLLNQMLTAYRKQFNKFPNINELSEMLDLSPEILKEALKARKAAQEVSIDKKRRKDIDLQGPIDINKIKREIKKRRYRDNR